MCAYLKMCSLLQICVQYCIVVAYVVDIKLNSFIHSFKYIIHIDDFLLNGRPPSYYDDCIDNICYCQYTSY